jgi:hypothetical protein
MDREFLAEIKARALESGEWQESAEDAMWVFPDGSGITSVGWGNIHGRLAASVGLLEPEQTSDYTGYYQEVINTLLSFGLVRRRSSYCYQTWDTSGFKIIDKYALKAGDNYFTLDVVARNESFESLPFEDSGWEVGKAVQEVRRRGWGVEQYSRNNPSFI